MPQLASHSCANFEMFFWKTIESEEELLEQLPSHIDYRKRCLSFQAPSRRREWLATRCLLHQKFGKEAQIIYRADGAPAIQFEGTVTECSISHSQEIVSIARSKDNAPLGLDIEQNQNRAHRLRHRFLNPTEINQLLLSPSDSARLWCAKEAVFKLCRTPGLGLLNHILLTPKRGELYAVIPSLDLEAKIVFPKVDNLAIAIAHF